MMMMKENKRKSDQLMFSPSFSWTDLNACLYQALQSCPHTPSTSSSSCCALCLLQAVQRHVSDSSIVQSIPTPPPHLTESLEGLEKSLGSFSQIGGNDELKKYLMEVIVKPCLEWKVWSMMVNDNDNQ